LSGFSASIAATRCWVSFDQAVEDMPARHEQLFGYAMRDRVIEITEVRVIALGEDNASA